MLNIWCLLKDSSVLQLVDNQTIECNQWAISQTNPPPGMQKELAMLPDMVWDRQQIFIAPLNLALNQATVSTARFELFYYSAWT